MVIAYYGAHFGEEPPLSGLRGSGNVFFSPCNLRCIYCQNYQISHKKMGREISVEEIVEVFLLLEKQGCHNINLVSPTPYVPLIALFIKEAKQRGIAIPFIYNTNAYENCETISILNGLIDIYLPDFKYWFEDIGKQLSDVSAYPFYAKQAIKEMKSQVGNMLIEGGIGKKGIIIRHLVLPDNLAGSKKILEWIGDNLGTDTYISLMSQYTPLYRASEYPPINRKITESEYDNLIEFLIENGFKNVFIQELESASLFIPDFNKAEPFTTLK